MTKETKPKLIRIKNTYTNPYSAGKVLTISPAMSAKDFQKWLDNLSGKHKKKKP